MLSGVVLLSIAAAIVAFALIAWSRRESWRPWAFYAPCLLANLAIVVLGRLGGTSGDGAIAFAYDLQYFVEAHVLLIVALAIALSLPPRPAWLRADPRVRGIARAVVGAVAAFVIVSTIVSWNVMVDDSAALPSKGYIERAVSDLDQADERAPRRPDRAHSADRREPVLRRRVQRRAGRDRSRCGTSSPARRELAVQGGGDIVGPGGPGSARGAGQADARAAGEGRCVGRSDDRGDRWATVPDRAEGWFGERAAAQAGRIQRPLHVDRVRQRRTGRRTAGRDRRRRAQLQLVARHARGRP